MEENNIQKQIITIKDRKCLFVEGVRKVDSFDAKEFLVDTILGYLHIKGDELSLGSMNMDKGTLLINGRIDSCSYLDNKEKKKEGFLKTIFK